jgi:hypothetical protein
MGLSGVLTSCLRSVEVWGKPGEVELPNRGSFPAYSPVPKVLASCSLDIMTTTILLDCPYII